MCVLSARVPESHGENKTVQTGVCRDQLSCFKGNALHGGSPCTAGVCPAVLLTSVGQVSLTSGIPQGVFFLVLLFSALIPYPIQYHSQSDLLQSHCLPSTSFPELGNLFGETRSLRQTSVLKTILAELLLCLLACAHHGIPWVSLARVSWVIFYCCSSHFLDHFPPVKTYVFCDRVASYWTKQIKHFKFHYKAATEAHLWLVGLFYTLSIFFQ